MTVPATADRARSVLAAMLDHQRSTEFADFFDVDELVEMTGTRLVLRGGYRRAGRAGLARTGPRPTGG